jgi:hypothetical protein
MGLDYLIRWLGGIASVAVLAAIKCRLYFNIGIKGRLLLLDRTDIKTVQWGWVFKETTIKHIPTYQTVLYTINSDMKHFVNTS